MPHHINLTNHPTVTGCLIVGKICLNCGFVRRKKKDPEWEEIDALHYSRFPRKKLLKCPKCNTVGEFVTKK